MLPTLRDARLRRAPQGEVFLLKRSLDALPYRLHPTPGAVIVTNRAHVLLWTDQTATYLDAIKAAGLADRVAIETLPRKDKPSAEQLARTEALMAGGVPAGLLPSMPKLRWAQAMSAGVEGWLSLPDLPAGLTLTCARGTHTESMPENIIGALFHVAKPYRTVADHQKQREVGEHRGPAAHRQDARHPGLGAIGQRWRASPPHSACA
jgi:phosphoglycerate dehydrogenase-like enzyme